MKKPRRLLPDKLSLIVLFIMDKICTCIIIFSNVELSERIALKGFVADLEAALWKAHKDKFPGTPIQGCQCVFHWTQAVFRKVQEHGLQVNVNSITLECNFSWLNLVNNSVFININ